MQVYSFLNIAVYVNGVQLVEWPEGDDAITVKRRVDSASDKIGADGKMVLSISSDKSGEFSFKLQQTSPSNKYLGGLLNQMEAGADTFVPISVRVEDTFRNDVSSGAVCYVKKPADLARGMTAGTQEWVIVAENLDMIFGDSGAVQPV